MPLAQRLSALDQRYRWWFSALLIVLILAQYAASIHFGLMWDDPRIYQATSSVAPWWKAFLIPSPPTQQYYRPLAVLYSQLMVTPPGQVNAPLAHTLHIGIHLTILLALVPLLRGLRFSRAHARFTALCFALFPPGYFDIAWHQTQQPLMLVGVILAFVAAQQFLRRRQGRYLALSLLAYALGVFVFEGGMPFVFVFFWLAWNVPRALIPFLRPPLNLRGFIIAAGWPFLHLGIAGLYLLTWLSLPLTRSVTGHGFQLPVLAYLTQGTVFPLAQVWAGPLATWPIDRLLILFIALWTVLSLGLWRWGSGRAAILSNLWVGAGLGPLWAGLSWEYAQDGARLFYPAAIGIAMVWGGWMALAVKPRLWQRAVGCVVLGGVVASSLWQFSKFQQMFQTSTQHLARAVDVLSASPQGRLLFVNFPDQINLRAPAYPLGHWGVIQAPVVQNLADYTLALAGRSASDHSLSASAVGVEARTAWPYRVNMRGLEAGPAEFVQAALQADEIYLTDYLPGGALRLRAVGHLRPAQTETASLAHYENSVQLVQAAMSKSDALTLRLVWKSQQSPQAGDTIFVHLWRDGAFERGADGGSLGELVPLAAWLPGIEITDIRRIETAGLEPGRYEVRVGIYNLLTNQRYSATDNAGNLFPESEVPIGNVDLP